MNRLRVACLAALAMTWGAAVAGQDGSAQRDAPQFQTSDRCVACHNGLSTAAGEDISIGIDWRTSLMANSARDPYWQASVRRETLDHGDASAAIQDECAVCHMPVARYRANSAGQLGEVFAHLPIRTGDARDREAADGVTCSVCHQIDPGNLGSSDSFNGGFTVHGRTAAGAHAEFGPFDIDPGLLHVMQTSTEGFAPTRGDHIRSAELCATCHTLTTQALGAHGETVGSLPEQMPYQEWLHSDYRNQQTCQSCHMPAVTEPVAITRVLGAERTGVARHQFVAANFFMQRLLGRYHDELAVGALPQELSNAAERTEQYLASQAARVTVTAQRTPSGRLEARVAVENLGGHKLPTAYPARRTWLHVVVRAADGHVVFESGALNADGSIRGNDNDSDPLRYEPHYRLIDSADQVQIYESILGDVTGRVTTGLLSAVSYLKDNRLLPHGFDKTTAPATIAVHGNAQNDPDFDDRGHRLTYSVSPGSAPGPFAVQVELWYQPIGYRWANNLAPYSAAADEIARFGHYYDSMSQFSATRIAQSTTTVP